jgi:hypothetical protein
MAKFAAVFSEGLRDGKLTSAKTSLAWPTPTGNRSGETGSPICSEVTGRPGFCPIGLDPWPAGISTDSARGPEVTANDRD